MAVIYFKILIILSAFSFTQITRADECCIRNLQPANSRVADAMGVAISAPHTVPSIAGMITLGRQNSDLKVITFDPPAQFKSLRQLLEDL